MTTKRVALDGVIFNLSVMRSPNGEIIMVQAEDGRTDKESVWVTLNMVSLNAQAN